MAWIGPLSQVGTRGYMPPEGHGRPSGDIYTVGAVLSWC